MTTALDRPPEEAAEDTSFARGLRVLLTIADRGEIRADELSTLLETPLSTVYRYLRTLTEFGFVERQEGGYRLGPRLHLTGRRDGHQRGAHPRRRPGPARCSSPRRPARPPSSPGGSGCRRVVPPRDPSPHALRVVLRARDGQPLHAGAVAKVLLAYAPPEIQDEVLAEVTGHAASASARPCASVAAERSPGARASRSPAP